MDKTLRVHIEQTVFELFGLTVSAPVEIPKDLVHGDYTSNIALVLAKDLQKKPQEIARQIATHLQEKNIAHVKQISAEGIGFINFSLAADFFALQLEAILTQQESWGKTSLYENKTILVEHSSPNLFKPFHIGHVMNNTIGESLVQLAHFSGAKVKTISFPSDISLGVAKALFILLEEKDIPLSIERLGGAYVRGTARYADDEAVQARVKEIADNLYAKKETPELALYEACKKINIEYFEKVIARLGSHFDGYIYESEAGVVGTEIVKAYTPRVFTESEGAVVYVPEESRKDINTAVFINSQGNPTYEAKDIGLLKMKFETYHPDISLFVTDVEQISHFQVVLAAAEHIQKEWVEKSVHVPHGRMSFKGQKMSSRLGGVPIAEELVAAVGDEVRERSPESTPETMDAIAIAAIKFSILRAAAGKNINFDPEVSLSFEGDSGPYLQYATVRAQTVLAKAEKFPNAALPEGWQTTLVEKTLLHFPYIVERAITTWSPHHVVSYLLELSQAFNSWYGNTKIIDDTAESEYKLAITKAFAVTMRNGLKLLGITVPEKM